ncbi:OmpA family protein [candidate division KSB1 bacterium]|nr:OmpA family protein [candidate division KSB1 bacterium]
MFQTKRFLNVALIIVIACITTIFVAHATGQKLIENTTVNDVKTTLFMDANKARSAAENAHADILAPKNYGEAMKLYKEAESDLQKGKKLEDIQSKLSESCVLFQTATDATKLADVTFPNSMKARLDAQFTMADRFSEKLWTEAEKKFSEAARELEDGDVNDAREKADEAEKLYRQAELDAIKANYLDSTRELLGQADKFDVKDYAPKTLQQAQQLVNQAEKELNENRYDTDVARSLAQHANYQARHAFYLAKTIKQMKDKDQTWEDLMLASEKPLQQIAEKAELTPSFDTGFGKTTEEIVAYIDTYQKSVVGLSQNLNWYQQKTELQDARIAEMENQFGSQAKEKSALAQQIANQAKTREQFANVEKSFTSKEARVLREGDDVIIRLVGLNFPSAEATIEQQSFGLLTKVRDAINAFPQCTVSVLGYTDSFGSDEKNLQLSKQRADAVKQYIMANSKIVASQIEAIGYGETKPIASNETVAGRAANRRVDVVIHPWMMKDVL